VRLTEIRTKLSATPPADRFAKIAKSIERGNDEVAAAVLNADRFFSDFLSDVEVSALQALWAKTRMPEFRAVPRDSEPATRHHIRDVLAR
jgi:hypothetical protein